MSNNKNTSHNLPIHHPCVIDLPGGFRVSGSDQDSLRLGLNTLVHTGIYAPQSVNTSAHPPFEASVLNHSGIPVEQGFNAFSTYAANYLAGLNRSKVIDSTFAENQFILDFFVKAVGDKPINAITPTDIDALLDALTWLPPWAHRKSEFSNMTLASMIKKCKQENIAPISLGTQRKHILNLKAMFHYYHKKGTIKTDPTLFVQMNRYYEAHGSKKESFSNHDLANIFATKHDASFDKPQKYWAPLISYYSGMRINEVAQLYVEDVIEVGGIWCFDISPHRHGQRVKSEYSRRYMPIHSALLHLGLMDYVADVRRHGLDHLFPGLTWGANGPGGSISIWFNNTHLRKACGILERSKTLHCFRHTFATWADKSGILERGIIKLLGHSDGQYVYRKIYISRADVPESKTFLEKIDFPVIPMKPYVTGRYDRHLQREVVKAARETRRRLEDGKIMRHFKVPPSYTIH